MRGLHWQASAEQEVLALLSFAQGHCHLLTSPNQTLQRWFAGIIFTVCCEPYLDSEYGDAFVNDSPVRLMDLTMHGHREFIEQEVGCFLECRANEGCLSVLGLR